MKKIKHRDEINKILGRNPDVCAEPIDYVNYTQIWYIFSSSAQD